MASAYLAVTGNASPISVKNLMIGAVALTAVFVAGCGEAEMPMPKLPKTELSVPKLGLNPEKFPMTPDHLAIIQMRFSEEVNATPYHIELIRTRGENKGYTLRSEVYESDDKKGKIHFAIAKQKEYDWFVGFQGRWEF